MDGSMFKLHVLLIEQNIYESIATANRENQIAAKLASIPDRNFSLEKWSPEKNAYASVFDAKRYIFIYWIIEFSYDCLLYLFDKYHMLIGISYVELLVTFIYR